MLTLNLDKKYRTLTLEKVPIKNKEDAEVA